MNVRLTSRRFPGRTELYSGVEEVLVISTSDALCLKDKGGTAVACLELRDYSEIALDEEGADP